MAERRRYVTLSVSSGIPKNYTLQHKKCESVKVKSISETTSELEVVYADKSKEKFQNLDKADIGIRLHEGVKVSYDKKERPKGLGWDNLGKWKGKRFVSIHEAWSKDIPFPDYYEKLEVE